ncbi:DUF3095 family protein [Pannonibacter sp.]|uniref:DUF3095 family protein n=1 Tax=Pannonibacter sp. TaxID=1906786 RepID=UPI003F6E95BE
MTDEDFYLDLPGFADFSGVADGLAYAAVPNGWLVAAADIVRSTEAIAAGRYKDVNMIGVAVISALLNRLGRDRLPFVFGGDGAMVLLPASGRHVAAEALAGVARLASQAAGLELRVALIPVSDLRAAGADIRLRKFELSPGNFLAMVSGDGLMLAEAWLKDGARAARYRIETLDPPPPDLTGFSCRWEPLRARHGRIVSLMARPTGAAGPTGLTRLMQGLGDYVGVDAAAPEPVEAPVQDEVLRMQAIPGTLLPETRLLSGGSPSIFTILRTLVVVALVRLSRWSGLAIGPLKPRRYMREMQLNTDFRKFDDTLRLVLDVTTAQAEALKAFLAEEYRLGHLVYGLTEAEEALMTCYVSDFAASQHVHFVDGANGGLALAARDFKQRQQALASGHSFDAAAKPA